MKCWSCNSRGMCPSEDLCKGWFKCSDCGATYSDDKRLQTKKKKAKK